MAHDLADRRHANRISPQHYVTFLEALKKATGVDAWSIAE